LLKFEVNKQQFSKLVSFPPFRRIKIYDGIQNPNQALSGKIEWLLKDYDALLSGIWILRPSQIQIVRTREQLTSLNN
jgi:hypothetical protein